MLGMFLLGIFIGALLFLIIADIVITIGKKREKKAREKGIMEGNLSSISRMSRINRYDINHPPKLKMLDKVKCCSDRREQHKGNYTVIGMVTLLPERSLTLYDSKNNNIFTWQERLCIKLENKEGEENE